MKVCSIPNLFENALLILGKLFSYFFFTERSLYGQVTVTGEIITVHTVASTDNVEENSESEYILVSFGGSPNTQSSILGQSGKHRSPSSMVIGMRPVSTVSLSDSVLSIFQHSLKFCVRPTQTPGPTFTPIELSSL